eukprot:scaffold54828_cov30-Tisochrysis_lutea.AAC.21
MAGGSAREPAPRCETKRLEPPPIPAEARWPWSAVTSALAWAPQLTPSTRSRESRGEARMP